MTKLKREKNEERGTNRFLGMLQKKNKKKRIYLRDGKTGRRNQRPVDIIKATFSGYPDISS